MAIFLVVLLLFFLSGFSALVYQVVWQRLLGLFTGAETVSVTLITSAYMLGMGIGSLAGGAISDKLKSRAKLILVFAAAELVIALFGSVSKFFFYDILYLTVPNLANSKVLAFITLFISLLVPTFFMGMTLPFLARAFISTVDKAVSRISMLYAVNTLGAAVGAAVTAALLIRNFGYETALHFGVAISAICAFSAGMLGLTLRSRSDKFITTKTTIDEEPVKEPETAVPLGFKTWMVLSGFSGFIALGFEIVWFRMLKVMLKANSMTYGWLLFIFLFGLALGTFVGSFVAKRVKDAATAFCLCQSLMCVYAVLSIALLTKDLGNSPWAQGLFEFFGRYNPIEFGTEAIATQDLLSLYVALPAVLIIPPTMLMGISFCLLQKALQTDLRFVGRRLGWIQAANIVGSTLGSLFVGLVSLHYWRTAGTLQIFLGFGCGYLFLSLLIRYWNDIRGVGPLRVSRLTACAAAALGLWFIFAPGLPASHELWAKLHGYKLSSGFIVKEDGSGVAALRPIFGDAQNKMFVYINGQGHSELPYGLYQSQIGLLPLFLHPEPKDIAIIGLGSGDTLYAAGAHKETENITCFEIVKPAFDCILDWNEDNPYGPIESMAHDKRMRVVFADGRKGLQREGRKYDIIQQDPLRSFDAGAGMVYSKEYFQLLQKYLNPGGFIVIWSPTARTRKTFVKSLPYVADFSGTLIGSSQPIVVNKEQIKASFSENRIDGYLERTGANQEALLDQILSWYVGNATPNSIKSNDFNSDLNPKDEFMVPQEQVNKVID